MADQAVARVVLVVEDREPEALPAAEDQPVVREVPEECRDPEDQADQEVREERDLEDWDNPLNLIKNSITAFITTAE